MTEPSRLERIFLLSLLPLLLPLERTLPLNMEDYMTIEAKLSASKSGLPKTATKVHGRKIVRAYKIPALPTKPNVRCQSPELCIGYLREIGSSESPAQKKCVLGHVGCP